MAAVVPRVLSAARERKSRAFVMCLTYTSPGSGWAGKKYNEELFKLCYYIFCVASNVFKLRCQDDAMMFWWHPVGLLRLWFCPPLAALAWPVPAHQDCAYIYLFCVGPAEKPRSGWAKNAARQWMGTFISISYSAHLINDKCVSIEMTPLDSMSLSLSQQRLGLSGHGMVHLLLIVNPSPSLQFLRDPGLVSHTLSRCCLNNKLSHPD